MINFMHGTLNIFPNRQEMYKYIAANFEPDDFEMIKRNVPYGKCFGYQNGYSDDMIGFASVSVDDEEMHIYTFEISKEEKGEGNGRNFYEDLVEFYKPVKVTLDPLDDDAETFWHHMGFQWDEDHIQMYKLIQ